MLYNGLMPTLQTTNTRDQSEYLNINYIDKKRKTNGVDETI